MYVLKGGSVPRPPWELGIRLLQLIFAIIIIGLSAYSLSIYNGGPSRPALIAVIIIAVFTIIPILLFTTALHPIQRRIYDPRAALAMEEIATLFWLGAFAALASYQHIFRWYGYGTGYYDNFVTFSGCEKCRGAWKTATAATVFAAFEFLLFLFTRLMFSYYYHRHMAGVPMSSTSRRHDRKHEVKSAEMEDGAGAGTGAATNGTGQHPMPPIRHTNGDFGVNGTNGPAGTAGTNGGEYSYSHGHNAIPYPDQSAREGAGTQARSTPIEVGDSTNQRRPGEYVP